MITKYDIHRLPKSGSPPLQIYRRSPALSNIRAPVSINSPKSAPTPKFFEIMSPIPKTNMTSISVCQDFVKALLTHGFAPKPPGGRIPESIARGSKDSDGS